MKKILLFTLILALLALSMASCKVEPKEDEVAEDEVIEDEVVEDEGVGDEVVGDEVVEDEVVEDEVVEDEVVEDEVIEDEVIEDEVIEDEVVEETVSGIPKELYDTYGESVINPEEDDYSYIRINFDESKEISGYAKLGVGFTFDDCTEYIDSNGAVYSDLPEGGKYSYLRDWQDAEVPVIEGVDAVAASPYGGNLLQFVKDGKYGYLNTDGEIVIEAQFYEARPFSEGLAAVCREYNDCLEYINEKGETVLKLEDADGYGNIFLMVDESPSCDFSDGVALVYCGNEGFCIDKQGNRLNVKNPVGMHKQGRIAFRDEETGLYGFADKYGNIVIPAIYHGVFDFSQSGIALVKSTRNYNIPEEAQEFEFANYYRGYIDTEGNVVIPIEFEQPWWYYGTKGLFEPFESYGVVSLYKQGYIYYYRYDGTLLGKIPRMAYVRYKDKSYKINVAEYWQWVNDGKDEAPEEENLQPKYNIIYTPSDEIPAVSPKELQLFRDENTRNYGYKTEAGEIIIPAIFYDATAFHEELAAVYRKDGGPLEYIDASGKTILTIEGLEDINAISYYGFQPPCIFNDGVAVIYDGGFCIDKTGKILNIKNPEGMYKYGLIAVRDPETNLKGYADIDGNIVIPCKYADVRDFEPQGVALVFSKESTVKPQGLQNKLRGYINTNGEEIIPLEYYDSPDCGASYIHPIHRDVSGMIELYKHGYYYYYFAYDGTLVKKVPGGRSAETTEIVEEIEKEIIEGVPKGLYDTYGESIINAEEDDYSYIRINFDESREISGYYEIEEGLIIDSNGKVYSDMPDSAGTESLYDITQKNSLVLFKKDNEYGYKNADGEIVIEAQFYGARNFSEGLAAVCREEGGYLEYINEGGETVLKLEDANGYYNVFSIYPDIPTCDFSDGLAMINGGDFYIDKEGNRIVIENACGMYKNGLVVIEDPKTKLQGYADINGNIVIPCKYKWAGNFLPCGVALVLAEDYYKDVIDSYDYYARCYGYVNKIGEEIIPLEFYTPYYVGERGLYYMPYEQNGIIGVYKEGFSYYYRYDGTLLGKIPHMKAIMYGDKWYDINLSEYWQWVNDGKPVG